MIFGNPSDFAIEAESDAALNSPKSTAWGHMRIWCQGEPVGDFTQTHCGLSGAQQSIANLAAEIDTLWNEALDGLGDQAIWDSLYSALYVDHGQADEQIAQDADAWSKFIFLTNWGEMFDQFNGFIFCRDSHKVRLLIQFQNIAGAPVKTFEVSRLGFLEAAIGFEKWCKTQC